MNFATCSDSRVHERFQRVCCVTNARNVLGTIVCEIARFSYTMRQSRNTQLVSERSSPKVDSIPRKRWLSHQSIRGRIASRREAEKHPEQQVTALNTDSAALTTRKATK